jgi:hypothetical protein
MKNKSLEVLVILFLTVLFFSFLSLAPFQFKSFKSPDFLAQLKTSTPEPKLDFDSTLADLVVDSVLIDSIPFAADSSVLSFGDLSLFFEAIKNLKTNPKALHVAYFGDSMIEGDLLTMDLRKSLQSKFGGSGVGFMPATSATAGFRTTIQHSFNDAWTTYHFNEKPPKEIPLGISGFAFKASENATVQFAKSKGDKPFKKLKLFYQNKTESVIDLTCDTLRKTCVLPASDTLISFTLMDSIPFNKVKLKVENGTPTIYGFDFENGSGVYVDNFSFRGNSGIPLASIQDDQLYSVQEDLNCKLVVLHYGLNVVGHKVGNYDWYIKPFRKAIKHIKKNFPNATIVLASVCDKANKENGVWNTEPDIPLFVNLQAQLAAEEGLVFWNLYKAMGGYNSMKKWVETEKPRLANKDYTHFNHLGASKAAKLFYDWLMVEYEKYLQMQTNETVNMNLQLTQ